MDKYRLHTKQDGQVLWVKKSLIFI
jgi:hypothetical protein